MSPALLHLYDMSDAAVVVIDIFRATTTIVSALYHGAHSVVPVDSVDKCIQLGQNTPNSITAGERDGFIAEGLEYGNSPTLYHRNFVEGKNLILTTTNGTRLLFEVDSAPHVLIGAFTNLSATAQKLLALNQHTILCCASWKDRINMEDSLFAGALAHQLQHDMDISCDSAQICMGMYGKAEKNIYEYLKKSNHYRRLSSRGHMTDLEYCTTIDSNPVTAIYKKPAILTDV